MNKETNIAFLDTSTLSAYLFLNPNESVENKQANEIIAELKKKKHQIFIPIQAIQEILACPLEESTKKNDCRRAL